ncbi:MAG TPA: acetyl-CoA carboxylase biotin carboxylase subunit [Chloroflexota bacterium]|nr:acetyl-CoA carboxylase biotin carboxylase subunit [Chloroflexota bacterium]
MNSPLVWPFQKVLIANRGEIALRVIQACRELGLGTVAVYSDADRDSLPVAMADEAYEIGPPPSAQSYLNFERILAVARESGAGAIHPGYGFLAENAAFARACREAGITFVGPSPESMEAVGGKIAARALAEWLGIPVIPGQTAAVESVEVAAAVAERVGYPVAIKASAGGGGRGLKVVHSPADLPAALESAQREGAAYFGDPTVFMERYLRAPRHIEVQIAGDQHGTVLAVGTRDCSVQRNHQKLIEEAPAPLDPVLAARIMEAARRLAAAIEYTGAGTAEFLVEGDQFFFLEMNTRIQVEHTVTEAVTGLDLVKMQLLVAAGAPLPFGERDCQPRGHAIECRINAEDPAARFRPGPGLITRYRPPTGPGIRVDSAAYQGYTIPAHYDSMIGKLIAWGRDREEALARMDRALAQFRIGGIPSTIGFHRLVLADPDFVAGGVSTTFVGGLDLAALPPYVPEASPPSPNPVTPAALDGGDSYLVEVNGKQFRVKVAAGGDRVRGSKRGARRQTSGEADGAVVSPMHGVVLRVAVEAGQRVESGDLLLTIEAMKMENEVLAPRAGTVKSIGAVPGATVDVGTLLAVVE